MDDGLKVGAETYALSREGLKVASRQGPPRWGPTEADQLPANGYGRGKIPASEYRDPARYDLELDRVFRANWLVAAHEQELPEPGDHQLFEAFGETVLIVRQKDGDIRAFHNVCRHRGARLVSKPGCGAKGFVCPWHGMFYGLDGKVRTVREAKGFRPEDLEGLRALPVRCERWGGFVFINIDGAAPPLDEYLGDIKVELDPYRMGEQQFITRATWDIQANWKIVCDGFLELYHTPITHASVDSSAFRFSEGAYTLFDKHNMMAYPFVPRYAELLETLDHQQFAGCHFMIFPNTMVNCHAEHSELYHIVPMGLNSARLTAFRILQRDAPQAFYDRMDVGWKLFCGVIDEDAWIDGEVGATLNSSGFVDTFTHERECRIFHFHEAVNRSLYGDDWALRNAR